MAPFVFLPRRNPRRLRKRLRFYSWQAAGIVLSSFLAASNASGAVEQSLHEQIDQLLAQAHPAGAAPIVADAEFARRAYLTFSGVIPTAAQARAFMADPAQDKRAKLVDTLLETNQFKRWFAVWLDVTLMERRAEKHVKVAPWRQFLDESVASNKPWNQLVRELLSVDGTDEATRAVARWCLEREGDPHALTRDIGRIFFGRDMACAQCHDHPRIDDYLQRDYYGLEAFVSRTFLFQPDANKPGVLAERADGDVAWTSVFTKVSGNTRPRLPKEPEISEPNLSGAELWIVPPNDKDKNVRPIPRYSRRAELAAALSDGRNPAFRRNIANRLWAFTFGRGLVEPLDLQHSANPPTDPALLDLLADAIAGMNFDMRAFIRELAVTHAFERALDIPAPTSAIAQEAIEKLCSAVEDARIAAENAFQSEQAWSEARQKFLQAHREAEPIAAEVKKLEGAVVEAKKAVDAAAVEIKKADEAIPAKKELVKTFADAAAKAHEANEKAPDTAELVAAAKLFQARLEQANNDVTAAEKNAAAKRAEAETKTAALTAAQGSVQAATAKLEEARKHIAQVQEVMEAAAARKENDRIKARYANRVATELKALASWRPAADADEIAQATSARATAALAAVRQTVERLTAEVKAAPGKIAAFEETARLAAAQLASSGDLVAARRATVAALGEASAKANEVAAKLPKDAEIVAAAAALKTRAETAAGELATLEKTIAEAPAKAEAATKLAAETRASSEKAAAEVAAAEKQLPALEAAAATARAKAEQTAQAVASARETVTDEWSDSFASKALVALAPEQLCWSVMQATGFLEQQRAQAAAEWDKKNPSTDADKADAAKQLARDAAIEKALVEKVRPHEDQYVRSFGGAAGQPQTEFFATPEQALYFENGGVLRGWAGILSGRLAAITDANAMAEELYLSTLTRMPTEPEKADLAAAIAKRPADKKAEALTDAVWALLTSNEFRFAH
jgi:hypothetical protein